MIVLALVSGALSFARGHQIATHQWKQWNLENHTSTEEFIHILTFKGTLLLSIIQVRVPFHQMQKNLTLSLGLGQPRRYFLVI